jgi:hypothetical protein
MKIEVKIVKENKDGSADAQVNFDKDGLQVLVQWGLVAMLENAMDKYATEKQMAVITSSRKKKKPKQVDIDGRC